MSEMGDDFRAWRDDKRNYRAKHGVECPRCHELRPRTNASILLPGQRCRVDGYVDQRKRTGDRRGKQGQS